MSPPAGQIAGLILAAGESRRMGSPKALLPYRGVSFVETLTSLFSMRCNPVIVVVGAHAGEIQAADWRRPRALKLVVNENYRAGQTSSLQAGLRAVPPQAEGVLFTLVDHPAVSPATLDAVIAPPYPLIRIPRYAGQRGHPGLFRRDLIPEFLALPAEAPANRVTRAHRAETEFIDLADPGIVADIDDPAAYRQLIQSCGGCE